MRLRLLNKYKSYKKGDIYENVTQTIQNWRYRKTIKRTNICCKILGKELNIKPRRSEGGQRFYQTDDFEVFQIIKTLLYDHKFTLAGAKKKLAEIQKNNNTVILTTKIEAQETPQKTESVISLTSNMHEKLLLLKDQLNKFKSIL